MTIPDIPVPDRSFALSSKPIILFQPKLLYHIAAKNSSRNVGKADVHDDVIKPALSEVRQDVLPGKFNDFVEQVPEMDDERISQHERSQKPVYPVNSKVMVYLLAYVLPSQRAVVSVDVKLVLETVFSSNVLRVELFPKISPGLRSLERVRKTYNVDHENQVAYVAPRKHSHHLPESLVRPEDLVQVRSQVGV